MIRYPSSAGFLYPDAPFALRSLVTSLLEDSPLPTFEGNLRAIVSPHSSYRYAGEVAGSAFRPLQALGSKIEKVLLLGPSHRLTFPGVAIPTEDHFLTPLGHIPIDEGMRAIAERIPGVADYPGAHSREHSLEIQLPFLQHTLGAFTMLPLLVGNCPAVVLAEILENLAPDPSVLVVISSELSHGHSMDDVTKQDTQTVQSILGMEASLTPNQASGAIALNGLLSLAKQKHWQPHILGLHNSGETADNLEVITGYGAFVFFEIDAPPKRPPAKA